LKRPAIEFDRMLGKEEGLKWNNVPTFKIRKKVWYYETLNIQVNSQLSKYILSSKGSPTVIPAEVIRATEEEKNQIKTLENLQKANAKEVQNSDWMPFRTAIKK
jgi:methylmalonyl-CoA mutase